MNASEFIRENPRRTAKELIEMAKDKGLKFSPGLVYMVRSKAKSKKNGAKKKVRRTRKVARRRNGRATVAKPIPVSLSAIVDQFKKDLEASFQERARAALEDALS